ncbi:class I SAM-dependent methyltransferase [Kitasatospora sp. NPDC006697]|uniref:class I SAM-dependent methyltransferase n=1 Tax=Kitasatospora sp. NPDC006697 TaxID=3364020 RepID=UPI003693E7CE
MTSAPRSRVFGEVAELYDRARPGYQPELYAALFDYAGPQPYPVLEIGAGTGKATAGLAERGGPVLCLEPDPRMAEVLRRNTGSWPQVEVAVGGFEEWRPQGREFGVLLAATCWHWVDPEQRWDLVHGALRPGGTIALCWNPQGIVDGGVFAALQEVNQRYGVLDGLFEAAEDMAGLPEDREEWPLAECLRDGRFTEPRSLRFAAPVRYSTEEYVGLQASISAYRILSAATRELVLDEIAAVLDANGGGVDVLQVNDLFLARRAV